MKNVFIFIFILLLGSTLFTCKKTNSDDTIPLDTIYYYVDVYNYILNEAIMITDESDSIYSVAELTNDSVIMIPPTAAITFNYDKVDTQIKMIGWYFNAPADTLSYSIIPSSPAPDDSFINKYIDTINVYHDIELNYCIFEINSNNQIKLDTIIYGQLSWLNDKHSEGVEVFKQKIISSLVKQSGFVSKETYRKQLSARYGSKLLANGTFDYEVYFVDVFPYWNTSITDSKLTFFISKY